VFCQRQSGSHSSQYSSLWTSLKYSHQMPDFSLKMQQIQLWLRLCPRPHWGAQDALGGFGEKEGKVKREEWRKEKEQWKGGTMERDRGRAGWKREGKEGARLEEMGICSMKLRGDWRPWLQLVPPNFLDSETSNVLVPDIQSAGNAYI